MTKVRKLNRELAKEIGATHTDTTSFKLYRIADDLLLTWRDGKWIESDLSKGAIADSIRPIPPQWPCDAAPEDWRDVVVSVASDNRVEKCEEGIRINGMRIKKSKWVEMCHVTLVEEGFFEL